MIQTAGDADRDRSGPERAEVVVLGASTARVWRRACGDLVAPIVAHCVADLAL